MSMLNPLANKKLPATKNKTGINKAGALNFVKSKGDNAVINSSGKVPNPKNIMKLPDSAGVFKLTACANAI